MIKVQVQYYPYSRYGEGDNLTIGHIKANSLREALIKMLNEINMYTDGETIEEIEEEEGRELTVEDILKRIASENGDGCDFITLLKNEDTGEVYLQEEPSIYNEWEI